MRALGFVLILLLPAVALAQPAEELDAGVAADEKKDAAEDGVDALRKEYLRLRDQLFRSRARAAAVGDAMYSTKLTVRLDYGSGRFYSVSRATVRLDGANVFDDIQGAITDNKTPRFVGYVAPGRHQISVRVEAAGKDDDRFTSVIESTFTIQTPAGKAVTVDVSAADEGDIPYQWKKSESGTYKLRLDVEVDSKDLPRARKHAKTNKK